MQLCSFLKWACILTVLDCCLELGAIPVSSKRGCASRPVHVRLFPTCIKCATLRACSFLRLGSLISMIAYAISDASEMTKI